MTPWTVVHQAPLSVGCPRQENWIIRKDPVAGKDWKQKAKGAEEDEMVR